LPYTTSAARPLPEEDIERYAVDAKASNFVVQAFSSGLLSAFGHNPRIAIRDIEGEASFADASGIQNARLHLSIRADSLEVIDDISDKDREQIQREMYESVLETDRFPQIEYDCSHISVTGGTGDRYWIALNGDLSLHGVTRTLPVTTRLELNGQSLRASGQFSLKQSDFEIKLVTVAAGAIRLKDELKFNFDIVARKSG
jgi:polyisoprenoid-binding protein YceI